MFKRMALGVMLLSMVLSAHAEMSETIGSTDVAGSQEDSIKESTLDSMTVSAKKNSDPHVRTELGKLTEATPISGSVVSNEELEHLQLVNNLLELGKRVPGISMVRNMRIPDGGKLYTENRIDGMRAIQTNTSVLDEVDGGNIERIDVVTGPGSALYGSGALGGTINVFTRQPPETFKAKLSQELGMWGFKRTQGNVGTTFADGRIGVILNGSMMDNDGWRKNDAAANRDSAAEHKNGVAFRGVVRPTDTTKISFGADQLYYDYRWAGGLGLDKFRQDWRQTEAGTYGQYINNYETKSIGLQQLIGDTAELKIAYARRTTDEVNNGNGGSGGANAVICDDGRTTAGLSVAAGKTVRCAAVNHGVFSGGRWSNATVTNTIKVSDVVLESTNVQFRKEFDLAKSTLYLGADTYHVTTDSETYNNAYNALQAQAGYWSKSTLASAGNLVKEKNNTPYVHFEFSPIEKLRLHIGERFDNIHYSTDDRTATNLDTKRKFHDSILKTGVTYDLTDSHLIWGNWSESFNAPAASTLVTSTRGSETTVGARLDPENSDTFEIGLRGHFDQIGLKYDATLYHTRNKGFVVGRDCTAAEKLANGVTTSGCIINENAGQLTARGFESMWSLAVNSWLDIGATYTLSEAYFNKYVTKAFDYSGNSYQAMPRHRLNLRVAVKPAPNWKIELEGDHYSKYYVNNENNAGTYSRPDLFNLRASYRSKDWSFWLHALNITDRQYATRVGYSTIAGVSQLAASAGQGNAGSYTPLTVRAGLSYDF